MTQYTGILAKDERVIRDRTLRRGVVKQAAGNITLDGAA